ncbi:MAG: M23 family metallopeptidase, partial [Acidobacteria bacterium]|nr:M23 family metallopeptidase [Acidobacteriota bacterium]
MARPPALATVAVFSLCGFTLACGTAPREILRPQRGADILLEPETFTIERRVGRHETLASILKTHEIAHSIAQAAIGAARRVFDPRRIRIDRSYRLVQSVDGFLREFEYSIDDDRFLRVAAPREHPVEFDAEVLPYDKVREVLSLGGSIDVDHPSLVAAVEGLGQRVDLAIALADIFAGEIDFNSDLQPGDSFQVLFESSRREGQFAGYGPVYAAEFVNEGRRLRAFRFAAPGAQPAYYDEQGRSVRKFFLRSPLKFAPQITSRFSRSRLHPVLRQYRAHLGVDYRAPAGAPVVAVASGTVVSAGMSSGAGRMVQIRHASSYESQYLHLSSIAVRRGAHVRQGQLVGRVGSSGLATGPHLDYRLKKNGVFVNPLREHRRMPPGEPVPASLAAAFEMQRDVA